jgi:Zn-dependent protease with chaperone function
MNGSQTGAVIVPAVIIAPLSVAPGKSALADSFTSLPILSPLPDIAPEELRLLIRPEQQRSLDEATTPRPSAAASAAESNESPRGDPLSRASRFDAGEIISNVKTEHPTDENSSQKSEGIAHALERMLPAQGSEGSSAVSLAALYDGASQTREQLGPPANGTAAPADRASAPATLGAGGILESEDDEILSKLPGKLSLSDYHAPPRLERAMRRAAAIGELGGILMLLGALPLLPVNNILAAASAIAPAIVLTVMLLRPRPSPKAFVAETWALLLAEFLPLVFIVFYFFRSTLPQPKPPSATECAALESRLKNMARRLTVRLGLDAEQAPETRLVIEPAGAAEVESKGSASLITVGQDSARLPTRRLAGILAHEFAHIHLGDAAQTADRAHMWDFAFAACLLLSSYIVDCIPGWAVPLAQTLSGAARAVLSPGQLVWAGLFAMVLGISLFLSSNRQRELRADHFSGWLTHPSWLIEEFRADPLATKLFSLIPLTHPSHFKRVRRLKEWAAERERKQ